MAIRLSRISAAAYLALACATAVAQPSDPIERYRVATETHLLICSSRQMIATMDPKEEHVANATACVKRAEAEVGTELQAALRAIKTERGRAALRDYAAAWLAAIRQYSSVTSRPSALESRATKQRLDELWARYEINR